MNVMSKLPSERRPLDLVVADGIRSKILQGDLNAGAHLVEADFAREFDVSNGTIRAALRHLQNEGLVEFRPRRGMFVADLRPEDALELYSIRDSLEALAAEEAAKKATEQEKAELSNILKKMNAAAKARDRKRCLDLDLAFHKHIVAMSKHSRVQQMYSLLESQIRLFIALTEPMHKDLFADIVQIHEPIASAILVGNWKTAQALSAHHNRADGEALARSIELALFQEKA